MHFEDLAFIIETNCVEYTLETGMSMLSTVFLVRVVIKITLQGTVPWKMAVIELSMY
jgi:hypothetical protein